jgi:hypothetical protein
MKPADLLRMQTKPTSRASTSPSKKTQKILGILVPKPHEPQAANRTLPKHFKNGN